MLSRVLRIGWRALWCGAYIVLAGEVFLRLIAPVAMLPRFVTATDFGIRANSPDETYQHSTPEYRVELRTNSKGVRADREFPYEKPDGVFRIVVLGDSFGLGYGVSLEDMFLTHLEEGLESRGAEIELINLCVSGHGTAEELIMLRNEGVRYAPDLVLVVWHSTDLGDNVRCGLFQIDEEGQVFQTGDRYLPGIRMRERLYKIPMYRWVAGHSHFYNWARELVALRVREALFALKRSGARKEEPVEADDLDWGYANPFGRVGALSLGLMKLIEREARSVDASLVVLDIPDRVERSEFLSRFPRSPEGNPYGFDVVSPMPAFLEREGELLYWERSHGHLTPLATGIVGGLLVEHIAPLVEGD